jgi:putative membrane protein
MKTSILVLSLLSAASLVKADTLTSSEKQFVEKAAAGNTAEIKLAQLAEKKSRDSKVKDFANRMITDHGKANNDLKPIADAAHLGMSDQLEGEAKATYIKLERLSGPDFDRSYISGMVKDHRKDAAGYQKAQSQVKDPQLKIYVDNTLPVVQSHLSMAEEIQKAAAKR